MGWGREGSELVQAAGVGGVEAEVEGGIEAIGGDGGSEGEAEMGAAEVNLRNLGGVGLQSSVDGSGCDGGVDGGDEVLQ